MPQLSSSLCWASPPLWRRIHTLWVLDSGCFPRSNWTQHTSAAHAPILSLGRHHPNRLSSTLSSVPLGSSVLISEMQWGPLHSPNGICSHSKIPRFPTVKAVYYFNALSIVICQKPTFRSKKYATPIRLSMASCIWEADRSLSYFWHLAYKSQCKSTDFLLSCAPILLH